MGRGGPKPGPVDPLGGPPGLGGPGGYPEGGPNCCPGGPNCGPGGPIGCPGGPN